MADVDAMRLDQSVSRPEQDRYGFRYISAQSAQSVHAIGREGSAVIGIEGARGSGKTSLVASLMLPVASIIAAEEECHLPPEERKSLEKKKAMTRTAIWFRWHKPRR
ncbi:hypothetical protein A6J71_21960 [Enterobacter cancerogenus]|uniref:hypothetical protein n=1 Tax=Enterobacter cancerogenus TaxID=69218 RepID=UPI000C9C96B0|nr:hypothetical protein [Enterobacter cancerogenus]PNF12654.1 hypothetical protein A6J71_21960 [Enterobacter cancerogenus]